MDNVILEIGLALLLIAFAVALADKLGLSNVPFLILVGMAVEPHAPQIGVFDFRFIETQSLIAFMGRSTRMKVIASTDVDCLRLSPIVSLIV